MANWTQSSLSRNRIDEDVLTDLRKPNAASQLPEVRAGGFIDEHENTNEVTKSNDELVVGNANKGLETDI